MQRAQKPNETFNWQRESKANDDRKKITNKSQKESWIFKLYFVCVCILRKDGIHLPTFIRTTQTLLETWNAEKTVKMNFSC